ncbi:MAG: transposase family protein [Merismopedia sp. SIO2A8]|nr:transposase family protein [Merismopedia sp. SIO2A8]
MLNIERVLKDDRLMRAMTGMHLKAFNALKPAFAQSLEEAPVPRRSKAPRQRTQGAGRKPTLSTVEHKLFYILVYFKCYPTFDLAGLIFDMDRSCKITPTSAPDSHLTSAGDSHQLRQVIHI